jgi:regulator of sigma E protease
MAIVPFLVLFSILVFVHEGGHFLFSKLFGVKVEEFGFGYPPRILGKKIKGTIYSINLIPFGGFARIKGEDQRVKGKDSFSTQSLWKRALIIFGGVLGNFLLAWALFTVLLVVGNPVPGEKVFVDEVLEGSPAAEAGIEAGDHILSFEGERVETAQELISLTDEHLGKASVLEMEREGEVREVAVTLRTDPPGGEGPMGVRISTGLGYEKTALWKAPFVAFGQVVGTVWEMVTIAVGMIRDAFRGEEVLIGGPVAIFAITGTYASYGLRIFLQFMAFLSLNLVIINLLPFPALDGGRLLLMAVETVRGKRVAPKTEQLINQIGFIILVILMVLLSVHDIRNFFF